MDTVDNASNQHDVTELCTLLRDEYHQQVARRQNPDAPEPPPAAPFQRVSRALLAEVTERYSLPPVYQQLLAAIGQQGFSILPGPFQEMILYAAPDLEGAQVGFRGPKPGTDTFIAPHGWRRSWIVIAYDTGDPYFLDLTRVTPAGECPVWTAMHGTGTWEPQLAASSLQQFLQILRVWVRIVVPQYDPQNPDEPLDDAHLRRLTAEITAIDAEVVDHWTL